MKIVAADNFNSENREDFLVCANMNSWYAAKIADLLNKDSGEHCAYFFKAVEDDYILYVPDWMKE